MIYIVVEYERSKMVRLLGVVSGPDAFRATIAKHNSEYPREHRIVEVIADTLWQYQGGFMYWKLVEAGPVDDIKPPITA